MSAAPAPCPFCGRRMVLSGDMYLHAFQRRGRQCVIEGTMILARDEDRISAWNRRSIAHGVHGAHPDLLISLKELVEVDDDNVDLSGDEVRERLKRARAAIATVTAGPDEVEELQ